MRLHRTSCVAAALVLALVPSAALGSQLELGLEASAGFDDNVFATDGDEEADVFLRLGPRLAITDDSGEFSWQLRYRPRYEKYVDLGELDGWDHDAYGRVTWKPSSRTTATLSDQFIDYDNFTPIFSDVLLPDGTVDSGIEFGRERFRQNAVTGLLEHMLGLRHTVNLGVNRYDNRFTREIVTESEVTVVSGGYAYALRRDDNVGVQLSGTRQEISDELRPARRTDYYNVSFGWVHVFDPTFRFDISAGPAWVESDEREFPSQIVGVSRYPTIRNSDGSLAPIEAATCPRLDDGSPFVGVGCEGVPMARLPLALAAEQVDLSPLGSEPDSGNELTYFASASLTKQWEAWALVLRYSRRASTTADVSGSIRDNLSASLIWRPGRRWTITFNAYYEMREELSTGALPVVVLRPATVNGIPGVAEAVGFQVVEVENQTEVDGYLAGVYVTYALTRRTQLFGNASWYSERSRSEVTDRSLDRFRVVIGVIFTLPAIELPL